MSEVINNEKMDIVNDNINKPEETGSDEMPKVFPYTEGLSITPTEFIELMSMYSESDESQSNIIASIIKRRYVPITEKRIVIEDMFKKSVVNDNTNYYIDQFTYRLNMRLAIVAMYTNFDILRERKENPNVSIYDLLNEYGIINAVIEMLDDDEIEEVNAVAKSIKDTWFNANKTIEAISGRFLKEMAYIISNAMIAGATEFTNAVANGIIPADQAGQMLDMVTQIFGEMVARKNAETLNNNDDNNRDDENTDQINDDNVVPVEFDKIDE